MSSEWQPIETAPKDGRYIIGLSFFTSGEWSSANICRWQTAEQIAENEGWGDASEFEEGWDCEGDQVSPRFWIPMPTIPGGTQHGGE